MISYQATEISEKKQMGRFLYVDMSLKSLNISMVEILNICTPCFI